MTTLTLRFNKKIPKGQRKKLASVAQGQNKLTKVDKYKVVIKNTDQNFKGVSLSGILLAPKPQKKKETE